MGIDAGIVEHHVRSMARQQRRQVGRQHGVIDAVAGAGRDPDVEIAGLLRGRIVGLAMKREGEDLRLALEDCGGAVALMDVEIDHQGPLDQPFAAQHADGDGDIVEEAEARAVAGEGMVAAAGGVAGEPLLQREAAGEHGPAHGGAAAAHERVRERQPEAADGAAVERQPQHRVNIGFFMSERQPRARRRGRFNEARRRNHAVLQQHVLDPAELPDGEAMAGRQRDRVVGMKDDREGHGNRMNG